MHHEFLRIFITSCIDFKVPDASVILNCVIPVTTVWLIAHKLMISKQKIPPRFHRLSDIMVMALSKPLLCFLLISIGFPRNVLLPNLCVQCFNHYPAWLYFNPVVSLAFVWSYQQVNYRTDFLAIIINIIEYDIHLHKSISWRYKSDRRIRGQSLITIFIIVVNAPDAS
jgi:hypothetical protein